MGNKRSFEPTSDQRDAARSHVVFELQMLRHVVGLHRRESQSLPRDVDPMCLVSALRDSALLHARNLHDFFLVEPTRDDIVASDFLEEPQMNWSANAILTTLAAEAPDINKFRSHLTYTRTERSRSWPLDTFLREIDAAFDGLLENMSDSERNVWREMIDDPDWRPTRQRSGFLPPRGGA